LNIHKGMDDAEETAWTLKTIQVLRDQLSGNTTCYFITDVVGNGDGMIAPRYIA